MAEDGALIRLEGPASTGTAPLTFFSSVFERLRGVPGILGVSGSTYLLMSGNVGIAAVSVGDRKAEVFSGMVTPNYFSEMEIPIVRGRGFDERDTASGAAVAIVNEAMVRKLWPDGRALGSDAAAGRLPTRECLLSSTWISGSGFATPTSNENTVPSKWQARGFSLCPCVACQKLHRHQRWGLRHVINVPHPSHRFTGGMDGVSRARRATSLMRRRAVRPSDEYGARGAPAPRTQRVR